MKRFFNKLLFVLPYLVVFLFSIYQPTDPDLGWHLKYGEYFFQHASVLRDNPFSTLMPTYQWANTSWLTDVISYATFHLGGFLGISLLGAGIVTLTFYFFSKVAKLTLLDQSFLFPLLLYLEQSINAVSFRGQQISLLFIGILFYIISLYNEKPKVIFFTIPLFFFWANLHGEFLLGLALFALWIGLYCIKSIKYLLKHNKKEVFSLIGTFIACTLATSLNPFGIGIHIAALSHLGSPLLKDIAEYLPFAMFSQAWWNQVIVAILLILGFIYLYFKNKVSGQIPLLGAILIVFILSFEVRRYAWPAYYLTLPILQPIASYFKPDTKRSTQLLSTFLLVVLFSIGISSQYPFTKYTNYSWDDYCKTQYIKCSSKSAQFLKESRLNDNVFTLYGWGGWLIWNYPEIKPTIDGRMHLWRENGYSAFEDYYALEQNMKDINKSAYNIVYMSPEKPVYNRLLTLTQEGKWEKVYEDNFAGVFVRKK